MQLEKLIEILKEEILQQTNPISIFLYGSFNTAEFLSGVSDVEIGVIKGGEKSISKILRTIAEKYSTPNARFRVYAYDLKKLNNLTVDSPFTKSVFTRRLILTSKTIAGEKIIENLSLPPISLIDAYREACFSTMRGLSGLFFLRFGKIKEASEMGYKATLFATASLEFLLGEFPIAFKNIVEISKELDLDDEWNNLIGLAYKLRQNKLKLSRGKMYDFIFKVITYSNQVVEERIKREFEKGNRIIIS